MHYVILDERLRDKKLDPPIMIPSTELANSVDLRACIDVPSFDLYPNESQVVNSGIKVKIPENTIGMLLPRSGLGVKGLVLGNLVGNIDPDYVGEIMMCLWNRTEAMITITALDRVAQLVVIPTLDPNSWLEVVNLPKTKRGNNGFSSTGIK